MTNPAPTSMSPDKKELKPTQKKRWPMLGVAISIAALVFAGIGVLSMIVTTAGGLTLSTSPQPEASARPSTEPEASPPPSAEPNPEPTIAPEPEPEPMPEYDLDSPDSLTVVVNKQRPLTPLEWAPSDLRVPNGIANVWGDSLREEAATALEDMYAAASAEGLPFTITSGYRDFARQKSLYDRLVAEGGTEYADRDTARPGHSEHQTGLAVDLYGEEGCQLQACFGETATGIWLKDNVHRFGYILRYHNGETATVGYVYEPWHFRYVGVDVSQAMHDQGVLNLEDFFELPAAPDYK